MGPRPPAGAQGPPGTATLRHGPGRRYHWRSGAQGTFPNSDNAVHTGGARPRGEAAGRAPHSLRRPEQGLAPCLSLGFLTCEMEYLGPGKSAQRRWSPPPRTWKARHSLRAAEGSGRRGLLERTPEQTSLPHQCKRGSVGHDRRSVIRPRGHAPAHAPAHRGRAATRPRSLLLDFYLSPLRET